MEEITRLPSDPYEVALLAGGPERVAQVALAELLGTGLVSVDNDGRLIVQAIAKTRPPLEQVTLALVFRGKRPTLRRLRRELERSRELRAMRADLEGRGFVKPGRRLVLTRATRMLLKAARQDLADAPGVLRVALLGPDPMTEYRIGRALLTDADFERVRAKPARPGHAAGGGLEALLDGDGGGVGGGGDGGG